MSLARPEGWTFPFMAEIHERVGVLIAYSWCLWTSKYFNSYGRRFASAWNGKRDLLLLIVFVLLTFSEVLNAFKSITSDIMYAKVLNRLKLNVFVVFRYRFDNFECKWFESGESEAFKLEENPP